MTTYWLSRKNKFFLVLLTDSVSREEEIKKCMFSISILAEKLDQMRDDKHDKAWKQHRAGKLNRLLIAPSGGPEPCSSSSLCAHLQWGGTKHKCLCVRTSDQAEHSTQVHLMQRESSIRSFPSPKSSDRRKHLWLTEHETNSGQCVITQTASDMWSWDSHNNIQCEHSACLQSRSIFKWQ